MPADRPETCAACSHPPHVGACSRGMGGTAYGCGCLRATPTPPAPASDAGASERAVGDAAREIDDERFSFFYAALAYAKARSLARTGADVAILGATEAIFDRAFENLGDDATWLSVAAERDAALRGTKGGTGG